MSTNNRADEPNAPHFITLPVVGWIQVFTRVRQKHMLIASLTHCQEQKGLEIYVYCIMTNHLYVLCKVKESHVLSDIICDFKKYTSKTIVQIIQAYPESRREWMLPYFRQACRHLKHPQKNEVWQTGYHTEIAYSNRFIKQKILYIHNKAVVEKTVQHPEDYWYTSARNYAGLDSGISLVVGLYGIKYLRIANPRERIFL